MNEESTTVEHIRGNFWHIYSVTVNQVMMATVRETFDVMTSI